MSKELYILLLQPEYHSYPYEVRDLREGMTLIKESILGWWKPRYLLDNRAMEAYEFLTDGEYFVNFSPDDVDWDSLGKLPEEVAKRARTGYAGFPTIIDPYENGRAKVFWQLQPDGMYYMDEDGYGMTEDQEIELVGIIDRTGKVLEKYALRKATF